MSSMSPFPRLLIVEDDPQVLRAIKAELDGFEIVDAPSYTPALGLLYERVKPVAVIAHLGMQDAYGGAQFMVEVKRVVPSALRLLYSTWPGARDYALDFADRFLVRPWADGQLRFELERITRREVAG